MKNDFLADKSFFYNINDVNDHPSIVEFGKAISNPERVKILYALQKESMNLLSLSKYLEMPVSTVFNHINCLEKSGLITVNYLPTKKGHVKFCNVSTLATTIEFFKRTTIEEQKETLSYEMPIGLYSECDIHAPCGLATSTEVIHPVDDPRAFFLTERVNAQLLWFGYGSLTYNFPNHFIKGKKYSTISFQFEICSETYYYNNNWPSDITIYINEEELLTFTSPGDFGGRRGNITPKFWKSNSTQFGQLKKLEINAQGVFFDNVLLRTDITFDDLNLDKNDCIKFTLKIKETAEHRGGMNLFGKEFGDYPQSIIMLLSE